MRKYTRKSPKTTTATPPITGWCLTKDMTPTFSLPPWFAALTNQPNHRGAGSCVCQVDETAGQLLVAQVHPSETADVRHPGQYGVQSAGKEGFRWSRAYKSSVRLGEEYRSGRRVYHRGVSSWVWSQAPATLLLTRTSRVRTDHAGDHVGPEPSFEFMKFDHLGSQTSSISNRRAVG